MDEVDGLEYYDQRDCCVSSTAPKIRQTSARSMPQSSAMRALRWSSGRERQLRSARFRGRIGNRPTSEESKKRAVGCRISDVRGPDHATTPRASPNFLASRDFQVRSSLCFARASRASAASETRPERRARTVAFGAPRSDAHRGIRRISGANRTMGRPRLRPARSLAEQMRFEPEGGSSTKCRRH